MMCLNLIEKFNVLYLRNCTGLWNVLEMPCTHLASKKREKPEVHVNSMNIERRV